MTVGKHMVAPVKRKPKPWTRGEERRASELYASMPAKEVARILGRTKQSVEDRLCKLVNSPKKKNWKNWTNTDDALLLQCGNREASCKLGRSVSACQYRRHTLKLRDMNN